jgi:hypothetical protein
MKRCFNAPVAAAVAVAMLVLISGFLALGCNSTDGPTFPTLTIGDIAGPDQIDERCLQAYSIEAKGDSSVTYQWTVKPAEAGYFVDSTKARAVFCPSEIATDTSVQISVSILSAYFKPAVRNKNIQIKNVPQDTTVNLSVTEILGPLTVEGGSSVTFGVEVNGDTGVICAWTVDPPDSGTFTHPALRYTNFEASKVASEKKALLRVEIVSDHAGPVVKTREITLVPSTGDDNKPSLSVNEITGPAAVKETATALYSVTASGDTGITYEWSVDPPDAGWFDSPNSPCVVFTPGLEESRKIHHPPDYDIHYSPDAGPTGPVEALDVTAPDSAVIGVKVTSHSCGPISKTRQIGIINDDPIVSWVEAPTEIMENAEVNFSIMMKNFAGPLISPQAHLYWTCDPPCAGTFHVKTGDSQDDWSDNVTDYYLTSNFASTVTFRASEVSEDTPIYISVFYVIDNLPGLLTDDEWIILTSKSAKILNNDSSVFDAYCKEPFMWCNETQIVGPTEVVETYKHAFYYSVPIGDDTDSYQWSYEVIDDPVHSMPNFNSETPDPLVIFIDTITEEGELTGKTVEMFTGDIGIETWVLLSVSCSKGSFDFPVCIRSLPSPCWKVEPQKPRYYSFQDIGGPCPPQEPEQPSTLNPAFEPYGATPPFYFKQGDILRLFAIVSSFRVQPGDMLECKWECYPENTVHFWGDQPYVLPQEDLWRNFPPKECSDEEDPGCGSEYSIPDAGESIPWVEMTINTGSMFEVILTINSQSCGSEEIAWVFSPAQ